MPHNGPSQSDYLMMRYAHPFFTTIPPENRQPIEELNASRMAEFIAQNLGPIPKPKRTSAMKLAEVIGEAGVQEIEAAGSISFHATGDTGQQNGGPADPQEQVAHEMAKDYRPGHGGENPAFLLHLGDVIYGHRKDLLYRDEYYRPYMKYPGKIVAIAGNHDGETFPGTDPKPCEAFLKNFCAATATLPSIAVDVRIFRKTMTQPGVYWLLDAPFLHIVGLYSNIAEGPGFLTGAGGDDSQKNWLAEALKAIALERAAGKRKALILAVHHPPFSAGLDHQGSPQMLADIDAACAAAGLIPDAVLSGHSHSYQRYTRRWRHGAAHTNVPFLVAGCGGHHAAQVRPADHATVGEVTYESSRQGFGYLLVKASADRLELSLHQVTANGSSLFDGTAVDLHAAA
jgi:Calcineurin-like phosphoesterase